MGHSTMLFRPQDIIVFIIGGATYAEARELGKVCQAYSGVRVVLGGTCIHNSSRYKLLVGIQENMYEYSIHSFLNEVAHTVSRWTPGLYSTGKDEKDAQQQRQQSSSVQRSAKMV
jgi:Sec1 family